MISEVNKRKDFSDMNPSDDLLDTVGYEHLQVVYSHRYIMDYLLQYSWKRHQVMTSEWVYTGKNGSLTRLVHDDMDIASGIRRFLNDEGLRLRDTQDTGTYRTIEIANNVSPFIAEKVAYKLTETRRKQPYVIDFQVIMEHGSRIVDLAENASKEAPFTKPTKGEQTLKLALVDEETKEVFDARFADDGNDIVLLAVDADGNRFNAPAITCGYDTVVDLDTRAVDGKSSEVKGCWSRGIITHDMSEEKYKRELLASIIDKELDEVCPRS